ncbi:MAG: hypothetical protein ACFFCM_07475 [Promethearchaeota archaeon]
MKEYQYVYENSKGELNLALTTEMLLGILLIFWLLPLIALGYWIWHFFTDNVKLVTKEDYYRQRANFHKKQAHKK